jgi:hypothetical protein
MELFQRKIEFAGIHLTPTPVRNVSSQSVLCGVSLNRIHV